MNPADAECVLVGDIGGTTARFALLQPGEDPEQVTSIPVSTYPSAFAAIAAYLATQGSGVAPRRAAIAVAAPIGGDEVSLTNHSWAFSQTRLAKDCGFARLTIMNDFEAVALALPYLHRSHRDSLGGGEPVQHAPMAVLGPGTGLGVALTLRCNERWVPIAGEGGHVDFAPGDEDEVEILRALWRSFGHASIERALSGPGLVSLYHAVAERDGLAPDLSSDASPADVVEAALNGRDPIGLTTLSVFSGLLGAVAGNLALTVGARGGVFVAGGVVARLGAAFDRVAFRRRFEEKGRFSSYVAAIPAWLILHPQPALFGLARAVAA